MTAFNLVDDPWIEVLTVAGATEEVGLRELFHRSTDFISLAGEMPTQDFAVLRAILAAFGSAARDVYGSLADIDIEELWQDPSRLAAVIDPYLDRYRDRFDLFHPKLPFMQVPDMTSPKGQCADLSALIADCPGDSALYSRTGNRDRISYGEAARFLIHAQAYDTGGIKSGMVGDPDEKEGKRTPVKNAGQAWGGQIGGIMLLGKNLHETILLNTVAPRIEDLDDRPIWEEDEPLPPHARPGADPRGPLGLFTWPNRRFRLVDDGEGVIGVFRTWGDALLGDTGRDRRSQETMTGWKLPSGAKKNDTSLYLPATHDVTRTIWQGLSTLLPARRDEGESDGAARYLTAENILALAQRVEDGVIPEDTLVSTRIVGAKYERKNKTKIEEEISDSLRIPATGVVPGSNAYGVILTALDRADQAAGAFLTFGRRIAESSGASTDAVDKLKWRARARAYAELDTAFRRWAPQLTEANAEQMLIEWTQQARALLMNLADTLAREAPLTATATREVSIGKTTMPISLGNALNRLYSSLNQNLPQAREND